MSNAKSAAEVKRHRRLQAVAQDILYIFSNARFELPKHVELENTR